MKDVLPPKEWYRINRFIKELKVYTPPVVSVYAPSEEVERMVDTLATTEREPEVEEIERVIEEELASIKFDGSICIFGWKEPELEPTVKYTSTSRSIPPVYMVDDKPFLEPLHDILEIRYDILMVLLDQRKALLRSYKGSEIRREKRIKSYVGSKHKKGGWSQRRFSRIREIQIKKHFDSIAGSLRKFDVDGKELILVGGPSKAKKEFVREHLSSEIKNKTRIVQLNFSSTEEQTSRVLINQLDSFRKDVELKLLSGVEESIKRKLVVKENREILKALEVGAVEKLLVASDYYAATPGENELILRLIELAEQTSAEIEFITQQDVLKELHHHGSVIAILRYRLI